MVTLLGTKGITIVMTKLVYLQYITKIYFGPFTKQISSTIVFFVADKAPSEAVFRGTEFLSYDLSQTGGEPIVSAQDSVTFYFKTRQPNGLLFYTGKES